MEIKRKLGGVLEVSTVTMGCWAIAGDATWGPQDEKTAIDTIKTAMELGVNTFDSAEMYGIGYSEQILAKALKGVRDKAVICSKVAPGHTDTRKDIFKACEDSLQHLGVDCIDLYYLHWPNRVRPIDDIIEDFRLLRDAGKIKNYGVSNFGKEDLNELTKTGPCCVNQLPYNLLWRVIEHEVLPICIANNISVACYSPIAQGLLTGKFSNAASVPEPRARTRHFSPAHPQVKHTETGQEDATFQAIAAIRDIAAELGCPMGELALAWLIHQPGVATVIAGARTPEQMKDNAQAMTRKLPQEVLDNLQKATNPLKNKFDKNPDMWLSGSNSRYR